MEMTEFTVTRPDSSFPPPMFYTLEFPASPVVVLHFDPIRSIGGVITANPEENFGLWESMLGFVQGSGLEETTVRSTQAWNFGGVDVDTVSTFVVTAFGEAQGETPAPVPEPATLVLVLSGVGIISWQFRQRLPRRWTRCRFRPRSAPLWP